MSARLMTPSLVEEITSAGILAVAAAADLNVKGRSFGPCPGCGALERGSADERPPCGLYVADGRHLWKCHACGVGHDAVALASLAATGEPLSRSNYEAVRSWAAVHGLCSADPSDPVGPPSYRLERPRPAPIDFPAASRPPAEELRALVGLARPVTSSKSVSRWLESRGLDPAEVERRKLAAALPFKAELPRWARSCEGGWTYSGHRVLLSMWGPTGRLESVRARAIVKNPRPAKALAPSGFSCSGLVLADVLGRRLLRGEVEAIELAKRAGVVVHEGEPDFLAAATSTAASGPAVFGVIAGSWSTEIATRIPDRCRVTVRTHADSTGEKYAAQIRKTLEGRVELVEALVQNAKGTP